MVQGFNLLLLVKSDASCYMNIVVSLPFNRLAIVFLRLSKGDRCCSTEHQRYTTKNGHNKLLNGLKENKTQLIVLEKGVTSFEELEVLISESNKNVMENEIYQYFIMISTKQSLQTTKKLSKTDSYHDLGTNIT